MAKVEVTMPKMGESITEGTVITWHKQPGDAVEMDETLLEIGTDKVDTEVPSPAAGVLKEILVEEGDTVDVGTAIAILETEAEAAHDEAPQEAPPAAAAAPSKAAAEEATVEEEPEPHLDVKQRAGGTIEVVMPKMGESITEGTVIAWHKQPGDNIEMDETLLEIGTDKVDTEVPSPAAGVLQKILVEEGETVEVGTAIAVIATEAEAGAAPEAPAPAPRARQAPARAPQQPEPVHAGDGSVREPVTTGGSPIQRTGSDGRFFSPLVRSIAQEEGLSMAELESIGGSGREGRVTKEDVLAYLEDRKEGRTVPAAKQVALPPRAAAATAEGGDYGGRVEVVAMDRMRQIIADHMVRSKATSAHVTSFTEADVTNLVAVRENNKEAFGRREGVKLTYTPFFVKAAVEALREHPVLNASVEERNIVIKKDLHVGIAVAIGKTGLVAPVIRNAGRLNLAGLAHAAADLADRARSKQLQPDELQGGTFTLTNIGSLGSLMGTPIINQPQVAILAVGAIKKRPVVVEDPALGDVIAIRHMMYISLSYDHRIIDGSMAASFLQRFVQEIESYDPGQEL